MRKLKEVYLASFAIVLISVVANFAQPTITPMTPDPTNQQKPTFQWTNVSLASTYNIQIADNVAFSPTIHSLSVSSPATSYTPSTNLPKGTNVYWHLSDNYNGLASYSITDSFYVSGAPLLNSLATDTISTVKPTFSWLSYSTATSYKLQVSKNTSFSPLELDTILVSVLTCTPMTDLPEGRLYTRISSNFDSYTEQSPIDSFFILRPQLNTLNGAVTRSTNPNFTWQTYPNNINYYFEISNTNFGTTFESYNVSNATNYTLTENLTYPRMCYWRVSVNGTGYSLVDSLRFTLSPEPIYFGVNDTFTNVTKPTFKWHMISGLSGYGYTVEYDTTINFNSTNKRTGNTSTNASDTTWSPTALLVEGRNYWRVKIDSSANDFSEIDSFFVVDTVKPQLVKFNGDTIELRKPKLVWHPVTGANGYTIYVDTILGGSSLMYENTYSNTDTTKIPYSSFPLNKMLYWKAQSDFNYKWSVNDSFMIIDTTTSIYLKSVAVSNTGVGSKTDPLKYFNQVKGKLSAGDTLKIATGTYMPDTSILIDEDSITILGGYNLDFSTRNSETYITIIKGDNFTDTASYFYLFQARNVWNIDGLRFVNIIQRAINTYSYNSNLNISNCQFIACSLAVYLEQFSNAKIVNNIFAYGSKGVYAYEPSTGQNMALINNTFYKNSNFAFKNYGYYVKSENNIFAYNKLAYLNSNEYSGHDTLSYNNFYMNDTLFQKQTNAGNTNVFSSDSLSKADSLFYNNITALDPLFVDTTTAVKDLHLSNTSACQNIGNPESDYSLEPTPNGSRINLGAYGGTIWAARAGDKPTISNNLLSDTLAMGTPYSLSVTAAGTTPLTYQWQKNLADIATATAASFGITSLAIADSGKYRVVVTNTYGADTSNEATLLVIDSTPKITTTLVGDTIAQGKTFSLKVTASGESISYQWQKNSIDIANDTTATFSIDTILISHSGKYRVIASNTYGADTSNEVALLVIDSTPPNNVTALSITEESSSTINIGWTNSISSDVLEILVCASTDSLFTTPNGAPFNKTITSPGTAANITGFPTNGITVYVSAFVKDSAGNISAFSALATDTIMLTNSEIPHNLVSVTLSAVGDTAMKIDVVVPNTTTGTESGILLNISTDSAQVRHNSQDTLLFQDTSFNMILYENALYHVTWATFDTSGAKSSTKNKGFTLVNSAPVLTLADIDTIYEDVAWVLENFVDDYNNDKIHLTFETLPDSIKVDTNSTNRLSWTPKNDDVGLYSIKVTASDDSGGIAIDTLNLLVINVNDAPVLSLPVLDTIYEDSSWSLQNFVKDIENDMIHITLTNAPSGIIIDTTKTAIKLNWIPTNSDVGLHNIVITATDPNNGKDIDTLKLFVKNINDAPILSLPPLDTIFEDSSWNLANYVTDADGDKIYISLKNSPSKMIQDLSTNSLSWIPNDNDGGLHAIQITASDIYGDTDIDTLYLFVINVNDPPVITLNNKKLSGSAVKYTLSATDDNDTTFVFHAKVVNIVGTIFYSDSNSTGIFTIYPLSDGSYFSTCKVIDKGGLSASITDTLTISGVTKRNWAVSSNWNMISVPASDYTTDTTINKVILQHWSESNTQNGIYQYYKRVSSGEKLISKKSYWIKSDSLMLPTITVLLNSDSLIKQTTSINLNKDQYGWNQISSPFSYPVKWESGLTLWEWDEKTKDYIDAENIINPWKGYWVLAESAGKIELNPEPLFNTTRRGRSRSRFVNDNNWIYNLRLISELGDDRVNLFGLSETASDGRDKQDRAEPPKITDKPYIFFAHNDWGNSISEYASDIRGNWGKTLIYNVGISPSSKQVAGLKIKVDGRNSKDPVYLFVRTKNSIRMLEIGEDINIDPSESTQYITIFASRNKNLLANLPLAFNTALPYPNPSRGISNIKYTLPYRWDSNGLMQENIYNVSIKMYDIRGRMIRDLKNTREGIGIHRVVWDGKGNGGKGIASGAYFIRISADSFAAVKKIIMFR